MKRFFLCLSLVFYFSAKAQRDTISIRARLNDDQKTISVEQTLFYHNPHQKSINQIKLLKNKTELESKEKQIAELKTKIESLKKEVFFFKSKNSTLLTNETVFAVEKKKYLESVENTLKKAILQESIKIPNLQNLNDTELKDKMIELLEKTSKENNIPFSAFEKVFKDSEKSTKIFSFLRFGESRKNQFEETKIEEKNKLRR